MDDTPRTLSELIVKWHGIRFMLIKMINTDYGEESPVRNQIAMVMEQQLSQCIQDLEAITQNPMTQLYTKTLLKAFKEYDEDKSR